MVRKKQLKGIDYTPEVKEVLESKTYINGVFLSKSLQKLPDSPNVREELEKLFRICSDRNFRLILVEDFGDYKVFIQLPAGKSECDFYVWYVKFDDNENLIECRIPTHDYLADWYTRLKAQSEVIDEYLVNSIIRLIRDRMCVEDVLERYFNTLPEGLKRDINKFLSTLKWIALQEDVNYPPPRYLGSKFTLAVYALLEAGFALNEIRKVVKF